MLFKLSSCWLTYAGLVYFGAVEWATLTAYVNHQIEKLRKQGLLANKADNTCDNTGIMSPSEKKTEEISHIASVLKIKRFGSLFLSCNFWLQPRVIYCFLHLTVFLGS